MTNIIKKEQYITGWIGVSSHDGESQRAARAAMTRVELYISKRGIHTFISKRGYLIYCTCIHTLMYQCTQQE